MREPDLDRLFKAATARAESPPAEMPYGFDTRVVALARAQGPTGGIESWELARLLRRVALAAVILTAFASSAAYWEMSVNEEAGESLVDAYAIADTAITTEFLP